MAAIIQSNLDRLLERTDQLKSKLRQDNIYPTDEQWESLLASGARLIESVTQLRQEIEEVKSERKKEVWEESDKHRSKARLIHAELLSHRKLKSLVVFRRNVSVIFGGPKLSVFDSPKVKVWKTATGKRCETLRKLSPDAIIAWATAYSPTVWAGGAMAQDVFDCLVDNIEPEEIPPWPAYIADTLRKLKEDEISLQGSGEYDMFLRSIDNPHSRHLHSESKRGKKRLHLENAHPNNNGPASEESSSKRPRPTAVYPVRDPSGTNNFESFHYLRRNAVESIPDPLRRWIKESRTWKNEESAGQSLITHCMSLYLSTDYHTDACLNLKTIFLDHTHGRRRETQGSHSP